MSEGGGGVCVGVSVKVSDVCVEYWVTRTMGRGGTKACLEGICCVQAECGQYTAYGMCREIGVAEDVPRNGPGLWRSENEVCCCDERRFVMKGGGGRQECDDPCGDRECVGGVRSPFSFTCDSRWWYEVDECCGSFYIGRDGGVEDVWVVGG